ncbi:hypothetical protein BB561_005536 [Smittium simulii]|uniref:NDT80 domain-containing protein n=1 Tax=Smittium simulii TaxID=133385 RepID=A0A2T9Y9W1_9FUNG|nr:hypothetical protein BB561_005536 [Smittium simulii]
MNNKPEVFYNNLTKYSTTSVKKPRYPLNNIDRSALSISRYDNPEPAEKHVSSLPFVKSVQTSSLNDFNSDPFSSQIIQPNGHSYYSSSPKFLLNQGYPLVSQKYYTENPKNFASSSINYAISHDRSALKPPSFFNETKLISEIFDGDKSKKLNMQFISKVDKGFFYCKDGWACYRRNYFQISCSFTIFNEDGSFYNKNRPITIFDQTTQSFHTVSEFVVGLFGIDLNTRKKVELVQNTAKRDKTSRKQPNFLPITNKNESLVPGIVSNQSIATFNRIQFKNSTVNQSRRSITQQYYIIEIGLFAVIGNGTQMLVATSTSRPLIVRGRSPGYYADNQKYVSSFMDSSKKVSDNRPVASYSMQNPSIPKYEPSYSDPIYMNKSIIPYNQSHHQIGSETSIQQNANIPKYNNTIMDPSNKLFFDEGRLSGYQYPNYNYEFRHLHHQNNQPNIIDDNYVLIPENNRSGFKPDLNPISSHSQESSQVPQSSNPVHNLNAVSNNNIEPIFTSYNSHNLTPNIQSYSVTDLNSSLKNYSSMKYNQNLNSYSYVNHNKNLNSYQPQ